ncbi:MAG: ATP-binding protein [Candidatus Poribacteria bacterium]|nr:ATP-binding protein [Candidatus Poribacteria bacterium]
MPRRSNLADEIAAFANAKGGVILIGVDDGSEIVGLDKADLDKAEKAVVEICQDSIDPIVLIFTEKLRIENKTC